MCMKKNCQIKRNSNKPRTMDQNKHALVDVISRSQMYILREKKFEVSANRNKVSDRPAKCSHVASY